MSRRSSRIYTSLNRNKSIMGVEKKAFMGVAFMASMMFATQLYFGLFLVPFFHFLMQWLTKKEHQFFDIFLKYLNESDAYSSIPRPSNWSVRPLGWGRNLPW